MDSTCEQEQLQRALALVSRAVAAKTALPVLSNVLILSSSVLLARLDLVRLRVVPPPFVMTLILCVLVLGGSLGAVAINRLVPQALQLLATDQRPLLRHQVGRNNLEQAREAYAQAGLTLDEHCQVLPFIDDMAAAYDWADLVICRAGATTVCEIAAAGKPAIFIPFPHAVDDHQTHNAQWLSDAGAALLIQQRDLTAQGLAGWFEEFSRDRARLLAMAIGARALARPEACDLVTEQCIKACGAPSP